MDTGLKSLSGEFVRFCEAAWVEFPIAAASRMLGGPKKELNQTGWRAYDAWVSLANEATNQLYTNRYFADFSARWFEATLRWQHATRLPFDFPSAIHISQPTPVEYAGPIPEKSRKVRPARRTVAGRARRSGVPHQSEADRELELDRTGTA